MMLYCATETVTISSRGSPNLSNFLFEKQLESLYLISATFITWCHEVTTTITNSASPVHGSTNSHWIPWLDKHRADSLWCQCDQSKCLNPSWGNLIFIKGYAFTRVCDSAPGTGCLLLTRGGGGLAPGPGGSALDPRGSP